MKYETTSRYMKVRCNETMEEQTCETQAECVEWAKKVAHTFGQQMTFTITKTTEASVEIWADKNAEVGVVR